MFKPGEIEGIPLGIEKQFSDLEMRIMEDIVRRIKINGEITRAADWQIHRLHELGVSKRVIKKYIKDSLKLDSKEINHIYKNVIRRGYERDESLYKYKGKPMIPYKDNEGLQQLIAAVSAQTGGELKNITQTMGFAKRENGQLKFTNLSDYYQKTLDGAILDITSGAFDYNTVLKRVVKEMTNSGLRTVDYASGKSLRVESAARMAVMTGVSQVTAQINESNAKELDTEYFEVTCHGGARPEHQEWQGKVYTKKELETVCGLGAADGLCGCNCYHDYYPFFPGISERAYTDEELKRLKIEENTPVEYNGKSYTKYEATQKQRSLERTMRAERQQIHLLEQGGANEEDIMLARGRYRATSSEYTRFSKAMKLPQQRERVTVDGLGNVGVGKYKFNTSTQDSKIDYMSNSFRPTFAQSSPISFIRGNQTDSIEVKKVSNSNFNMVTDVENTRRNKAVRLTERNLTAIRGDLPKGFELPQIAVVDFNKHNINSNAIGGYDWHTGILYVNSRYDTTEKILGFVNQTQGMFANNTQYAPVLHELGHKYYYDSINRLAISKGIEYNNAKDIVDSKLSEFIRKSNVESSPFFLMKNLSGYAYKGYSDNLITEVIAESFSVMHKNGFAKGLIDTLNEVIL